MDEVGLEETRRDAAMHDHRRPTPGKISIAPTEGPVNPRNLSLAYSPGVACPCLAIRDDPLQAATLTSRANLVAIVTNGTAVFGLGNIGALAGKPVMEGKGYVHALKFVGGQGVTVGPIFGGTARPVHVLTPTSIVRRIVHIPALPAVGAHATRAETCGVSGRIVDRSHTEERHADG